MKALILLADGFEDSEFYYPYYRLLEEGFGVDVAGPANGTVTGKHGYTYDIHMKFRDIDPGRYELLVLPGGKSPETVRLNADAVRAVQTFCNEGKPVAAICHGAQILISAGVLKGRKATCWKGIADDIKAAGAEYHDQDVVVDQNLITSRCPDDLPAFCREIFTAMKVRA